MKTEEEWEPDFWEDPRQIEFDNEDEDIEDEQDMECQACMHRQYVSEDGLNCANCGKSLLC